MATSNEKLTPRNFFNDNKIVVSYNLESIGYSVTTQKTILYLSSGTNEDGSLKLNQQSELPKDTQLIVKAQYPVPPKKKKDLTPDNEKYFYVTVISGDNKLDQGYVRFDHVKKVSAEFIDEDFVPTSAIVGKVSHEVFNKTKFSTVLYASINPKRKFTSFSSSVPTSKPAKQAVVVNTYKDTKEPYLTVRSQPGSGKGSVVGNIEDGIIVDKLKPSASKKGWWRIKILSGKLKDKIGWVNGKWLDGVENKGQVYEVINTYKDPKPDERWLGFKLKPGPGTAGGNKLLGKLYDGEKILKLSRKKNWWRVRVITGDLAGQVGWAVYTLKGQKFFKPAKEQPEKAGDEKKSFTGEINNGTPLKRLRRGGAYSKVKVLAGSAAGLIGWVRSSHTRRPKAHSPVNQKTKEVELPLHESLISLREEFTVKKVHEAAGTKNINLKEPSIVPSIFNNMRSMGAKKPNKFVQTNVSFYNQADKTFDIVQPFYFTPQDKAFVVENSNLAEMPKDLQRLFIQQEAIKTKLEEIAPIEVPGKSTEELMALAKSKNITINDLGEQILLQGVVDVGASEYLKTNPEALQIFFESKETRKKIKIEPSLQVVQTPRWGYFTYKIPVAAFDAPGAETIFPDILGIEAVNFLVDLQQGTTHGTREVHGLLAELPSLMDNTSEITVRISDLEKRLLDISRHAITFSKELKEANKSIYAGKTEEEAKQQKSIIQQVRTIKTFPTFVKSATVHGQVTAEKLKSVENLAVNLKIKKEGKFFEALSSIVLQSTQAGDNRNKARFQIPVIVAENEQELPEEIFLVYGKLCLLEEEYVTKIDAALRQLTVKNFEQQVKNIEGLLKSRKPEDARTEPEFVFKQSKKEDAVKNYLVYMIASILRDGIKHRKYELGVSVPSNLRTNELIKKTKKVKPIEDYSSLAGPYTLGKDKDGNIATYTPDYSSLLKQIRWLTFNRDDEKPKLDYRFLQIKKFSKDSHEVIKGFKSPDYCWALSTDSITHGKLRDAKNYRTFFDELYKYEVYYEKYVKGSDPSREKETATKQKPPPTTFSDAFSSLSEEEKSQMLDDLYRKRYQMVEQAFGGSGCIEFVIKSVDTLDELYDNVVDKANWSKFILQAIDRFKCELSKAGDGDLSCLADFDALGTTTSLTDAKKVLTNFDQILKEEASTNLDFPILNFILDSRVPSMPSMDWFKCLRAFILSLIQKIIIGLIVNFVKMILGAADVQCKADFSKCEKSDLDPNSNDLGLDPSAKGDLASAGMPNQNADKAAAELKELLKIELTAQRIIDFITFLANQMPIAQFKALLNEDTPVHIFSFGKYLAHNYFSPLKFSDEEFRLMLNVLNSNYEIEAFIAATLFEQIAPGEGCPPELVNGDELAEDIKNILLKRLNEDPEAAGDDPEKKVRGAVEKRVSAFCNILNFSTGVITEINSSPALLAGFTEQTIAGIASQIITQLRVKPAFDFTMLKYLYTGNIFGDNPTKEDLIRADLSLAYNVLYRNYLLSRVVQDGKPETRNYVKQFNLEPRVFENNFDSKRWQGTKKLLRNDSFEKEFAKDLLDVFTSMTPFLSAFHSKWVAELYDVETELNRVPNGSFESMLLGASQELNNPNYFYAWAEELFSLIPIIDPRRFPKKYQAFVEENYPNAEEEKDGVIKSLESDYTLAASIDASGLHYTYHNGNSVLMKMDIGLEDFEVAINEQRTIFTRDLPKLSEPFFVDEEQDYKEIITTYGDINAATSTENPQNKIFNSLVEQSLVELGIYKDPKVLSPNEKTNLNDAVVDTFKTTYDFLDGKFKSSTEDSREQVARFFFQPFMRMPKIDPEKAKNMTYEQLKKELAKVGNPKAPVALFFERSDNIMSDIFFDDDQSKEVDKVVDKVKAHLKTFYKDMADGKSYDPRAIANAISTTSNDPKAFYEFQKRAASKLGPALFRKSDYGKLDYSSVQQEAILQAVKEITDE